MLEQLDQNITMDDETKKPLFVHNTNLFQPHKLVVTAMTQDPTKNFLAVTRKYLDSKEIGHPFTLIEIYETHSYNHPRYVQTIIEYEDITGVDWMTGKHIMTVSMQSTVNIYHLIAGCKIKTMTTDFGPITCMKYSRAKRLLLTSTQYGYVACYRLGAKGKKIELLSKMVKINDPIECIDFHVVKRLNTRTKTPKATRIVIPGKRKRNESSDEESDTDEEDEDSETFEEYLESNDITIYGASGSNVICWDFHRKTIVETMLVGAKTNSLVVLENGDIAVGDSNGYLSIFDQKSFTCRQNLKVLDSPVTCLTRSSGHTGTIMVTGQESTVALFKADKSNESQDEYVFFEKLKGHKGHVLSGLFEDRKTFFTSSTDGSMHKFTLCNVKGRKVLKRFITNPNFSDRIKFAPGNEVMVNQGKSLTIYKLVGSDEFRLGVSHNYSTHQDLTEPQKHTSLRVGSFIHAATFDSRWICYATRKRLSIHRRSNLQQVESARDKLPYCHNLKICCNGHFLVAGQQKKIFIIKLAQDEKLPSTEIIDQPDNQPTIQVKHKILFAFKTKGIIKHIFYHETLNQLLVTCGSPKNYIYTFNLPAPDETGKCDIKLAKRIMLPYSPLYIASNDRCGNNNTSPDLLIYTSRDQLIRFSASQRDNFLETASNDELANRKPIKGLPEDANILGLLVISRDHCIIYDKSRMFKVDIEANKIINETNNYKHITTMDKSTFETLDEILIVSTIS